MCGCQPTFSTRDEERDVTQCDPTNVEEGGMEKIHTQCEYGAITSWAFDILLRSSCVKLLATPQIFSNVRFSLTVPCTRTERRI